MYVTSSSMPTVFHLEVPFAFSFDQRIAADEEVAIELAHPADSQLERRNRLDLEEGSLGGDELGIDLRQPGLDPRHVEGDQAAGTHLVVRARSIAESQIFRHLGPHEDLEAEVTGIAASRNQRG